MKRRGLSLLICAVFVRMVAQIHAAEIPGTVRAINGETITVATTGDSVPNVGDKAEIFFKLAGVEGEVSVAAGSVVKVDGDSIEVKIETATGEVAKDQLVRITSEKPQKRAASAPTSAATPVPSVGAAPSSPASQLFAEAGSLYNQGDYDGAIAALNKAIAQNPNDAAAFYQRAICYVAKQAWENVIADASSALTLGYQYPGYAYALRGQGRMGKLDLNGSIEDFTKAIEINPEFVGTYALRAEAWTRLGKWKNALEDCNKAVAINPNFPNAYMMRGFYYSHLGATEAAEADWKKAIALDPANEKIVNANRNTFAPPKKKSSRKR